MARDRITRRQFVRDATLATAGIAAGVKAAEPERSKILNYNENMEYRPWGKTGLMVSAVCLGGHWKRIDKVVPGLFKGGSWLSAALDHPGFQKNRREVVSRSIEAGINYIDACTGEEVLAYSRALQGRRDRMYLGFSWYQKEMRNDRYRTKKALLESLDEGLQAAGLEHADFWRITMHEQSSRHTRGEVEEMMSALEAARKQGKARFTGFSSHDRPHIKWMVETYREVVDSVVTPYTANSKVLPEDSLFDTLKTHQVGCFGIKPFASNSLFKGDSSPESPQAKEDDERARLAIRYILCNPVITAPIPGLITPHQVDNVAQAVRERRRFDRAERARLEKAAEEMWARLPADYQWLKDWEYV